MEDERQELYSILHDVTVGVTTLDQACELADRRAEAGTFGLEVLMDAVQDAIGRMATDPQQAWHLGRIAAAAAHGAYRAADSTLKRGSGILLMRAQNHLISEATALLAESADIRVFHTGREAAQVAFGLATELGLPDQQGVALHRRAIMILACYARGTSDLHAQLFQEWVDAGLRANPDPDLLLSRTNTKEGPFRPELRWPEPLEALGFAESDLRTALPLVAEQRRGPVLKELSDALAWRERLGGEPAGTELVDICEQALDALAPDQEMFRPAVRETLAWARWRVAANGPPATVGDRTAAEISEIEALAARLESNWDAVAKNSLEAWQATGQASDAFAATDPARALRLLTLQRKLPVQWANEDRRTRHYDQTLVLLARMRTPPRLWRMLDSVQDFTTLSDEVLACAAAAHQAGSPHSIRPDQLGSALTFVALAGSWLGQYDKSLEALSLLRSTAPELASAYPEAYGFHEGQLRLGQGFREEQTGNHAVAAMYLVSAAEVSAEAGVGGEVIRALIRLTDLVQNNRVPGMPEIAAWCVAHALRIELLEPQSGPAALQRLLRILFARLFAEQSTAEALFLVLQAAKGRRMAAMLTVGTSGWGPDEETRYLLRREAEQVANFPADWSVLQPMYASVFDTDTMVSAYTSEYETSPSDTVGGALANLRRAIERKIAASIISINNVPPPATLQDVLAALDNRTALLVLYEGEFDGKATTFGMLFSHAITSFVGVTRQMPYLQEPVITMREDGKHKVFVPVLGHILGKVRRAVQEEPAPRNITRDGEERLAALAEMALAAVYRERDELVASGVDRLVIVPHGAYHFAPLHLAGPVGKPVAEDFLVTYLANLDQLTLSLPGKPSHRSGAGVFALSYADQPQLPYLESSATEGRLVGSVIGIDPVLDSEATKEAVIMALQRARWVHLRAHGKFDPDAPMFQTIFLSPTAGDDGRLLAHEIASLDLRELELVTLGACETSLGRLDISDNIRGLPASFLSAGAQAVIGTLWEVTDTASTVFFTALYRSLTWEGATVIEAFEFAQRKTKEVCPEYRDWGAFYLTGGYIACARTLDDNARST